MFGDLTMIGAGVKLRIHGENKAMGIFRRQSGSDGSRIPLDDSDFGLVFRGDVWVPAGSAQEAFYIGRRKDTDLLLLKMESL